MVDLRRPDPHLVLRDDPLYQHLVPGQMMVRVFQKTYSPVADFNTWGPTQRFDHHHLPGTAPGYDPSGRAVYYCAPSLSGCLAEAFGDRKRIVLAERFVALARATRSLRLLDLRRDGAFRAGTVAAVGATPDRALTQEWARFFYERHDLYGVLDGLIWANAHNQEDAIVLFERARAGIVQLAPRGIALAARPFRQEILTFAQRTGMVVATRA